MNRIAAVVITVMLSSCSAGSAALEGSDPALEERIARIEHHLLGPILLKGHTIDAMELRDRMSHYKVPGLSIAVVDDFRLAWARGYGVACDDPAQDVTPQTLFQGASISKMVTALVCLRLVGDGAFALDDEANELLTSWQIPTSEEAGSQPVLVRHLLSHSAGFEPFYFEPMPPEAPPIDLVAQLRTRIKRIGPSGRSFAYSNPAFAVLQQLIQDVTGKPFPEVAQRTLFAPLSLTTSTFAHAPSQPLRDHIACGHDRQGAGIKGRGLVVPAAVGGLWTTPSDLCRMMLTIIDGCHGSDSLLGSRLATQMVTRQVDDEGLGVALAGTGASLRFSHSGGMPGFRALVVAYPATGQGAAVMANADTGMGLVAEVMRALAHEYGWPEYVVEHEVVTLDPRVFARYSGRYRFAPPVDLELEITSANGRYYRGRMEMLPVSETRFVVPEAGDQLEFVVGDDGRADAFRYTVSSGQTVTARRVEETLAASKNPSEG